MIAPIVAGVAVLYGIFRYKKMKEQTALSTPVAPAVPPGYASPVKPSPLMSSIAKAVQSQQRANAAPLPQGIYGKGATTADVPSSRIPSSVYGTGAAQGPTPASGSSEASAGFSTSGGIQIKI